MLNVLSEFVRRPESSDGDEAFVGIDLIYFRDLCVASTGYHY